jgi:Lysyl-tRNA synthetase (class II)
LGENLADIEKLRKLEQIRAMGIDPYPYSYKVSAKSRDIVSDYAGYENRVVEIAGRLTGMRDMGKLLFFDLLDQSGKIQVLVALSGLDKSAVIIPLLDVGDIVGVMGRVGKTKKGEISVVAESITLLSKSLSIMPEKFHGLTDTELRYRKRFLDLIVNYDVREFFLVRSRILKYFRDFLDNRGYIEFETPVLQHTYGGANATPFKTRYEALDTDVYLRVADELYLKRLIIGGFERVYEVSKDFRNEDIDSTHNPEFTQIECYEAYKDYNDYMKMTEEMIGGVVKEIFGSYTIEYCGKTLDFTPPFERVYWVEELKKLSGIDVSKMSDEEAERIAIKEALQTNVRNAYHVADALFDKYIKPRLWNPAFVMDFPQYMCPLTKRCRGNALLSERFELYVAGKEEANCYSELTDPVEQKEKFEEQEAERKKGDSEAQPNDKDFLEAIEYGMPPTAGIGISIDRLSMILTGNASIKEVIAFPAMRPENEKDGQKR